MRTNAERRNHQNKREMRYGVRSMGQRKQRARATPSQPEERAGSRSESVMRECPESIMICVGDREEQEPVLGLPGSRRCVYP